MAKRVITECDLSKEAYDPKDTIKITIKSGNKTPRTYELCPASAAKLETQLVSNNPLGADWGFNKPLKNKVERLEDISFEPEAESDDEKVRKKKAELEAVGVDLDRNHEDEPNPTGCVHMNKGPVKTTLSKGKRKAYRICRGCGARVDELTKNERDSYMTTSVPDDFNVGEKQL